MQKIYSYMRRAVNDYNMLSDGDRVAVAVSGGKDSLALLGGLAGLRRFIGIDFQLHAVTLDIGFVSEEDYSALGDYCRSLGVPWSLKKTDIGRIVFDIRKEPNPCSLCARMRRGALHDMAKDLGCNKIALGHHADDAAETLLMNLFNEGRIGCFSPVSYLSRKQLFMIRPLIYAPEKELAAVCRRLSLPVVKSGCPSDGTTSRERMKDLLFALDRENRGVRTRLIGAMERAGISGWHQPGTAHVFTDEAGIE